MLTVEKIKQKLDLKKLPKPVMVIDSETILDRFKKLNNLIDGVELFYSVKTNPHPEILKLLKEAGSGFEISSVEELSQIISMGVPRDKIISGNTFKMTQLIAEAYRHKINYFAYDSIMEADKIAQNAPGSNVYLRVVAADESSEWPLSKKFGAPISQALDLLKYAIEKKLNPNGLTFHVGSQCLNPLGWSNALATMAEVYFLAKKNNIKLEVINLGGGFPSRLAKDIPQFDSIKANINKTINKTFPNEQLKYYIEPGRGLVGEAAIFVASVVAVAPRGPENWLILDVGVYNGLLEAAAGIEYEIVSDKQLNGLNHKDNLRPYNIGGPTCDSWDTIIKGYPLPEELNCGDIIYILNTGAYTNSEVTCFNGFGQPAIYII